MTMRSPRARALLALASLALVAAACGDDDDASTATTEAPSETTAAPVDETTTTAAPADDATLAGAALVEVTTSDLGDILASEGRTLYVFTPDAGGGASTCNDECAQNWPALLADGDVPLGEGLDEAMFATTMRDDGGEQVTVNGWPLYFFAGDAAAGETNGQGVGDVWWVVGPDGVAIEAA